MSRRNDVLTVLKTYDWVCGDDLVLVGGRRFSARIYELRHADGYNITDRICADPHHKHCANVLQYRLDLSGQMSLEVA